MSLSQLTKLLHRRVKARGNWGHAGRPGQVGGSATVSFGGAGIAGGASVQIPHGQYQSVYNVATNRKQAIKKADSLGPGHAVVRVNNAYHVINTTPTTAATTPTATTSSSPATPTTTAVNKVVYETSSKQYALKKAKQLGADHTVVNVNGKYQVVNTKAQPAAQAAATPPPKQYNSKVEELFDKASPAARQLALKTGLLATDDNALKYIQANQASFKDPKAVSMSSGRAPVNQAKKDAQEKLVDAAKKRNEALAEVSLFKKLGVMSNGYVQPKITADNIGISTYSRGTPAQKDAHAREVAEALLKKGEIIKREYDPNLNPNAAQSWMRGGYREEVVKFNPDDYKIVKMQVITYGRNGHNLSHADVNYTIVPKSYQEPPEPKLKDFTVKAPKQPKAKATSNVDFSKISALTTVKGQEEKDIIRGYSGSWDKQNHKFSGRINNVFKITAPKEMQDRFDAVAKSKDNVKSGLYHGTGIDVANLISAGGYLVPKNAKAGRMLGDGVYLANTSSKSMQYIGTNFSRTSGTNGVMFVNKASMGRMGNTVQLNASGKAYSATGILSTHDSLYAPKGQSAGGIHQRLINDEYVVKDPNAVIPDYWLDVTRT